MNLLAFDTSTEFLSLALMQGEVVTTYDVMAGQTHSQLILPQIQALLSDAGLQLKDLHGIAFGAGPGSFTGVRIAAGVAQGLGFGANLPVVGVCTLMAVAESSGAHKVIACLDARMGEIYHAAYIKDADTWQMALAPALYKPDAAPVIAIDLGGDWVGAGSGWQTYADIITNAYSAQLQSVQPQLSPTASAIIKLATPIFVRGEAKSASEAKPIYIRNRVALKTAEREQGLRL